MNSTEFNQKTCSYNRRHSYAYVRSNADSGLACHKVKRESGSSNISQYGSCNSNTNDKMLPHDIKTVKKQFESMVSKIKDSEFINQKIIRAGEWLEIDDKAMRVNGESKKMPSHLIAMITVIAVSLMLIVSGAVLRSKATMELYAAENELTELQSVQAELEAELELKNDLRYIESVARNKLGMIERDHASVHYIETEIQDKIEIYESEDQKPKISALLDALSFLQ